MAICPWRAAKRNKSLRESGGFVAFQRGRSTGESKPDKQVIISIFPPTFQELFCLVDLCFHLSGKGSPFATGTGIRSHKDTLQPQLQPGQDKSRFPNLPGNPVSRIPVLSSETPSAACEFRSHK